MTKSVLAGGLSVLLCCASLTAAQDQGPPLSPPALEPPAPSQAPATPRPRAASHAGSNTVAGSNGKPVNAAPAESHPLLVIPGVTAPVPSRPGLRPSRPGSVGGMDAVDLTGPNSPSTSRPLTPSFSSLPPIESADDGPDPSLTRRNSIPLTLESIPDEPPAELGSDRLPADRPSASRTPPAGSRRPMTEPSTPAASRPAPSRGSSTLFGRLLGLPGSTKEATSPRSSITVEPHSDPVAEASAKRRIEKQVQQAVGDRVRRVEIQVSGRSVIIRAQAARFWQRRSVRHSLETMTLPSGYRARVEMID